MRIIKTCRKFHWIPTVYLPVTDGVKTKLLVWFWWSIELSYTSGETLWFKKGE
jgi:hypothetical protein